MRFLTVCALALTLAGCGSSDNSMPDVGTGATAISSGATLRLAWSPPDAHVLVDGKKSQVAALSPGMRVTLHLSAEPGPPCVIGIVAITEGKKE